LLKKEEVDKARLQTINVSSGETIELTSMKELGAVLFQDDALYKWWRLHMGYCKDDT
jgi:hypothetical protein